MKHGEVWTVSGAGFAGKPRPALIIQSDVFPATTSLTICPLTSNETEAPLLRVLVNPSPENGLVHPSRVMVDKIMTVPRDKFGKKLGDLEDETMLEIKRAVVGFLGLLS